MGDVRENERDATQDALKILVLDMRDDLREVRGRLMDPDTGAVVRLGKVEDAVLDLRKLSDEDRGRLAEALKKYDEANKPGWLERHKEVVIALVGSGGAIAVLASALGSCG